MECEKFSITKWHVKVLVGTDLTCLKSPYSNTADSSVD